MMNEGVGMKWTKAVIPQAGDTANAVGKGRIRLRYFNT